MSGADGDERVSHQDVAGWPSQGDPKDDPVGAVRVHPADEPHDPDARRVIKTSTGEWVSVTQPTIPPQAERGTELHTWPHQSLEALARALGHPDTGREAHGGQVPDFWEVAKTYCRALHRLTDGWLESHRAAADEKTHRKRIEGVLGLVDDSQDLLKKDR
jgi:hypothetical protein